MRKQISAILLFTFTPMATISAQMVLCDGVWTNSSCEGIAERKVGTTPDLTPDELASLEAESSTRSLLHDTTMRAIAARREYGIDLSLDGPQKICRDKISSVEACRQATEIFEDRLAKRISQELEIAKAKKEVEEKQPANVAPTQTNIIIDERPVYVIGRTHHGRYPYGHGHGGHHGTYSAGGAAISVRGRSSDGNLSVGIDAGATQSTQSGGSPFRSRANSRVTAPGASNTGGQDVSGLLKRSNPTSTRPSTK